MDAPSDSQTPTKSPPQPVKEIPPSWRSLYLILYNFISAILWTAVLGRVVMIVWLHDWRYVFAGTNDFVRAVQTGAAMEVGHSVAGLVRAPLLTTLMQVASRFLLVWGIAFLFPTATSQSFAFTTMLFAWSVTEIIRYSYFAVNIAYGRVPDWLTWLRYNTFFVLYPLGISSECWLVWNAIAPAKREFGAGGEWALKLVLGVYVPGSYVLFTHMMAQRRKVMRSLRDEKKVQ